MFACAQVLLIDDGRCDELKQISRSFDIFDWPIEPVKMKIIDRKLNCEESG